jgi:hypothetical protein
LSLGLEATTRLATATAAVSVLSLVVGCGGRAPQSALAVPAAPPPAAASERPPTAPGAPASKAQLAGSIRLEPEARSAPPGPRPRLEFLSPTFGEILPELAVRKQEVSVQVVPALAAGQTLAVSLDGLRPRTIATDAPLSLGDLLPEDRALAPGAHSLLLVVLDAAGAEAFGGAARNDQVFALIDFYVGARDRALPPPDAARLFCLGPTGTYHGAASDRPLLELFAVGGVGRELPVRIEAGPWVFEALVDPRSRYRVSGLPAGDARVLAGANSGPRAECAFTLNPERQGGT